MIEGLTHQEREFLLWAMGFIEGAADHNEAIRRHAVRVAEKLKVREHFTATVVGRPLDVESDEALDDDTGDQETTELRYVELSWKNPDGQTVFTCMFVDALRPNRALEAAKILLEMEHPEASEVEEWLQRKVTAKTVTRIRRRMEAGTWQGWLAHGRMHDKVEKEK